MEDRVRLSESLLTFVPLMHKKLMKGFHGIAGASKQQLMLLFMMCKEDEKPMSYYSEKMMIPKSNLTLIADKLIEEDFVGRSFDPNDRRIIILKITEKGREYVLECKEKVRLEMMEKLELLNDSDIKRLNELIEEMKLIFSKLD